MSIFKYLPAALATVFVTSAGAAPTKETAYAGLRQSVDESIAVSLPEPVERYLAYAIQNPRRLLGMKMQLRGRVILPGQTTARTVTGEQFVAATDPEFDWQVKASVNWLVNAHIHDHYVNGKGKILARANGLVTLINDHDLPELNVTQLSRWAGLAVMAPTAMANPEVFTWEAVGPNSAVAIIRDGELSVRQVFHFAPDGKMVRSESSDRWERYDGRYLKTGSIMERGDYVDVSGYRVPTKFRITRVEPDGSQAEFWVGEFFNIEPVFAPTESVDQHSGFRADQPLDVVGLRHLPGEQPLID